jgi:hypothetical protein
MRSYAPDFRLEETTAILTATARAKSVSVIGTASIGKSNFVQHLLARLNVVDAPRPILPVLLDANLLPVMTDDESVRCWAGHELIMHRLYVSAYPFTMLDTEADVLFQTYQRLQDGRNPLYAHMGVRYLELALKLFFHRDYHVVLIFDEFESFMQMMPPQFFLHLRGLRDMHKLHLSYITFSRTTLPRLCTRYQLDADTLEPFIELFNDGQMSLGPYTFHDAQPMLQTMPNAHYIYSITGGFAGLMRAVIEALRSSKFVSSEQIPLNGLIKYQSIAAECEILMRTLDADEREVLRRIRHGAALNKSEVVDLLINKRLLDANLQIQPPLLAEYLNSYDL